MLLYLLLLFLIPVPFTFAEENPFVYEKEFFIGTTRSISHDLSTIDFQIIKVNQYFIPKWIDEPGDYSDILQIKFNVTNNELKHFTVYKNMFQIDVIDLREEFLEVRRNNNDFLVENYSPHYIEDFKLRFQDMQLPSSLEECTLLQDSIRMNQTKTLSVCFDVKQKWSNQPLNLDGPLLYYLVIMDNKFSTSCPNCIIELLNDYYQNPIIESKFSPRTQLSMGVIAEQISCNEGLELVFKNPETPACVKPKTAEILKNRGWAQ